VHLHLPESAELRLAGAGLTLAEGTEAEGAFGLAAALAPALALTLSRPQDAVPQPSLSAPAAAVAVLDALSRNAQPRANHGLSVAYAFCGDAAAMERSRFFGQSKDIYQFDHFMAAFGQLANGLIDLQSFDILRTESLPDGRALVRCWVRCRGGEEGEWALVMRRGDGPGATNGCWLLHRLLPASSRWLGQV